MNKTTLFSQRVSARNACPCLLLPFQCFRLYLSAYANQININIVVVNAEECTSLSPLISGPSLDSGS